MKIIMWPLPNHLLRLIAWNPWLHLPHSGLQNLDDPFVSLETAAVSGASNHSPLVAKQQILIQNGKDEDILSERIKELSAWKTTNFPCPILKAQKAYFTKLTLFF